MLLLSLLSSVNESKFESEAAPQNIEPPSKRRAAHERSRIDELFKKYR
jgi:hypothetical protein